jgi:hypothetical protein
MENKSEVGFTSLSLFLSGIALCSGIVHLAIWGHLYSRNGIIWLD